MSISRRGLKMPNHLRQLLAPGAVKAGVLAGATYPADLLRNARTGETRPDPREGMAVASIAAGLEFGSRQNHPRPFMQNTVRREGNKWAQDLATLLKSGLDAPAALLTLGQVMKEDIQATIRDWPADNSEEWAEFKGFNHGLVLHGHLLNSIDSALMTPGDAING